MLLSSSTDLLYKIYGAKEPRPVEEALSLFRAAGFTALDASLWVYAERSHPLERDNWREWVESLRACADELGISFAQTHGLALSGTQWDDPDYPDWDFFYKMNRRCIEATKILGAPWMVMHPSNTPHDPVYDHQRAKDRNLSYLAPYIELAKKLGVGIAVENMVDLPWVERCRYAGRYPEDLADLVETINDPAVGICVDTGHAHLSGVRPSDYIRAAGKHLKCTHIDDNKGDKDTHLMPFGGTVDWRDTVNALREIGYTGALSLELSSLRLPKRLGGAYAKFGYETLEQLLKL